MFENIIEVKVKINGRELDVSRLQAVMDKVFTTVLESDDPAAALAQLYGFPGGVVTPPTRAEIRAANRAAKQASKAARPPGPTVGEVVSDVAEAVVAVASTVAPVLSRKRGS